MDTTERTPARYALEKSEARFRFLFESMTDACASVDMTGHIREANHAFQVMLGYSEEELRGLHFNDLTPEKWHVFEESIIRRQILAQGHSGVYEKEYRKKDGAVIPVELRTSLMCDDAGHPAGMWAIVRDISDRKRAEEALRSSEAFLNTVIEQSPTSMWVADHAGTMIRMNQACRDLLHVTDDELVGKYNVLADNVVEEQGAMPLVKRVFERGESVRFLLRYNSAHLRNLLLREQADLVLEVTISPVLDSRQRVVHAVVQHHDITDRIRAEEELRASEERFKRLLQHSNDIIALTNAEGTQVSISGPVEARLGYTPDELVGVNAFEFFHPDDADRARQAFTEALARPGLTLTVEFRYRRKDGGWAEMEALGTNLLDDPLVQGIVLNVREISERRNAEREQRKLQDQLQQAMKMEAVGRLAGGIAHDFNNLLTAIAGNLELARLGLRPADPLDVYLDEASRATERAASLTRQLLAFSRRQIIEPKVLNLNQLVGNLRSMLERLIGEDIELRSILAEGLGSVRVDPGQFEQVLVNLAINARDAMPDGGKLLVETANTYLDADYCANHQPVRPGRFVLLAVSDTGHGMSDEVKQRLFEPFFTTKPVGRGTGLGLATIFGAVAQVGGSIEVYSEVGLGTTFKIYLPLAEGAPESLAREAPSQDFARGTGTILLVEDDTSLRNLAPALLKHLGYDVLSASNAGEALLVAEQYPGRIALLMTDVVMPGMNGRELADRLCQVRPETRVLFTSGYTENVIVHHGIVEQGLRFVGKPYSLQTLAKTIREILGPED
jgi:two-component system cell cycle sensor histidine kinase/response regulator CckA